MKKFLFMFLVLISIGFLSSSAFGKALLIEDVTPWDGSGQSNAVTLSQLSIDFDLVNSSTYAGMSDLSSYDYIVYSSDQYKSYYDNIASNYGLIDDFVYNGGTLLAHAAMWGWHYSPVGTTYDLSNFMPGGDNISVKQYSNTVNILDPTAPVIDGPAGVVTEASLQAWNYSTHGYFTGVEDLDNFNAIIGIGDETKACYIEYTYGAGTVRANVMTMEWGQYEAQAGSRDIFRKNEYYQVENEINGVPEPATMLLLGTGLVGLAVFRRKFK